LQKTDSAANSNLHIVLSYLNSLTTLPEKDTIFPLEIPQYKQFLRLLDTQTDSAAVPTVDGKLPGGEFHCRTVLIDDL
jgi:hypothetical protein